MTIDTTIARKLDPERVQGDYRGDKTGPTLVLLGAMHGNEVEGLLAMRRVFDDLDRMRPYFRGRLIGLTGNLAARRRGVRFIDQDLNRFWIREHLSGESGYQFSEFQEMLELRLVLNRILDESNGPISLIDMHSFSGEGEPFAISPGNERDLILLRNLPMPTVYGLDDLLHGTLAHYLHDKGHRAIGFEGGQKGMSYGVDNMEAFIWDELFLLDCIEESSIPPRARRTWENLHTRLNLPKAIRVDHRHEVRPGDQFKMKPGFRTFDHVHRGDLLARNFRGDIRSPRNGYLLMPLYQGQGSDGFFIGHVEVSPLS
ncbi:MAG: succinylglutamate desuccinylase/aspartoacylase family protein [Acidobacteriota bacterium]|nr:succinylglutamate desuccinylase/aspartoacylase family protein [Acidobacteriota bacterium]